MLEELQHVEDQCGRVKLYREEVLSHCYESLFEIIICGLESNDNKDLILELAEKRLRDTKVILDNYCD